MGQNESLIQPNEQIPNHFPIESNFSSEELETIIARFNSLSKDGKIISIQKLGEILKINNAFFIQRLFFAFNQDNNPEGLTLHNLVNGLSKVCPRATSEEKASFVFRFYDLENQNLITKDNLKTTLLNLISNSKYINLQPEELEYIINTTFRSFSKTDVIDFNSFQAASKDHPEILSLITFSTDGLFI